VRISKNERKRSAEEASPIITPPPNLRSHAHAFPPRYSSGDNSFDYVEESNEASTDVSPQMLILPIMRRQLENVQETKWANPRSSLRGTLSRKDQDFVKVHLKGKKSINKLLEKGGLINQLLF